MKQKETVDRIYGKSMQYLNQKRQEEKIDELIQAINKNTEEINRVARILDNIAMEYFDNTSYGLN